jgi:hypothetical protein
MSNFNTLTFKRVVRLNLKEDLFITPKKEKCETIGCLLDYGFKKIMKGKTPWKKKKVVGLVGK